jgi:toxin ParE1/3/4
MAHRLAPPGRGGTGYIAEKNGSIEIADRLIDSLTERFYLLSRYPHTGRRHDQDLRPGLRSFPVGGYLILYRIENESRDVLILHVMRGSRNLAALLPD